MRHGHSPAPRRRRRPHGVPAHRRTRSSSSCFRRSWVAGRPLPPRNEQLIKEVGRASRTRSASRCSTRPIDKGARRQAYGIEEVAGHRRGGAAPRLRRALFLGIPAGYEFSNLIDSIIAVSSGEAALTDDTKASAGRARRRRRHQGLLHPHLTALSPGPCAWHSTWRLPSEAR